MNIGDKTPEILGKDEQGRDIRLSDYKGRELVLSTSPTTDKFLMISGGQKKGRERHNKRKVAIRRWNLHLFVSTLSIPVPKLLVR